MVSVFFADTVNAKARHTSTMTSIIYNNIICIAHYVNLLHTVLTTELCTAYIYLPVVCIFVCVGISSGNCSYPLIIHLVPSPPEAWFRGMSMGGSFRRRLGRNHPREMQPTDYLHDSADRLRRGWVISRARLYKAI